MSPAWRYSSSRIKFINLSNVSIGTPEQLIFVTIIMMTSEKYSIPLLNASNYSAWSVQIEMILRERRVWRWLTEKRNARPNQREIYLSINSSCLRSRYRSNHLPTQDLEACEAKVDKGNATLFANMTQTIVNEHKNHKEPAILWTALQKRYAPKTTVRRMIASINFVNAKLNPDEPIAQTFWRHLTLYLY